MHGAAAVGSADVVELLLANGMDRHKHLLNKDKQTALEVAISRSNYSEVVKKALPQLKALLTTEATDNASADSADDDGDTVVLSEESEMDDTESTDL